MFREYFTQHKPSTCILFVRHTAEGISNKRKSNDGKEEIKITKNDLKIRSNPIN